MLLFLHPLTDCLVDFSHFPHRPGHPSNLKISCMSSLLVLCLHESFRLRAVWILSVRVMLAGCNCRLKEVVGIPHPGFGGCPFGGGLHVHEITQMQCNRRNMLTARRSSTSPKKDISSFSSDYGIERVGRRVLREMISVP